MTARELLEGIPTQGLKLNYVVPKLVSFSKNYVSANEYNAQLEDTNQKDVDAGRVIVQYS